MAQSSEYVKVYNPDDLRRCKAKLFCFPHAGGAPHSFASWASHPSLLGEAAVAADAAATAAGGADESGGTAALARSLVAVCCISYPGRGARGGEPLIHDHAELVAAIADDLTPHLTCPFIFFGHSSGAALAFEVARLLRARRLPLPLRVFLSSHVAPDAFARSAAETRRAFIECADAEFVGEATKQGWIPRRALDDPALLEVMLPVLRADISVFASWSPNLADIAPLALPCTVIGGDADVSVPAADLQGWAAHFDEAAGGGCELRVIKGGGHFHFHTEAGANALLADLGARVEADLAALPRSVVSGATCDWQPATSQCVHTQFEAAALRFPNRVAFVDQVHSFTFAEADARADLLARVLQEQGGVGPECIVVVMMATSAEYAIANLAIFKAGGAILPFYMNYTEAQISEMLVAADASCVITTDAVRPLFGDAPPCPILLLNNNEDGSGWAGVQLERAASGELPPLVRHPLSSLNLAYCAMSSGTTGKPKAILVNHLSTTMSFKSRNKLYPYVEGEDVAAFNIFFVWEVLRAPLAGCTALIVPDSVVVDPRALVKYLRGTNPLGVPATRIMVTASLTENMLAQPALDLAKGLANIHEWILCGEVCPLALARDFMTRLPHITLINDYSTWESLDVSTAVLTVKSCDASVSAFANCGSPINNVGVLVLDDQMQPLPAGVAGNVFIAGPIGRGYLRDPTKTAAKFMQNPLVDAPRESDAAKALRLQLVAPTAVERAAAVKAIVAQGGYSGQPGRLPALAHLSTLVYSTGDRGRITNGDQLELSGRAIQEIKIRGYKVNPATVAAALKTIESVAAAVVIPVLNERTQQPESLCAYVVSNTGKPSEEEIEALKKQMRSLVPEFSVPRLWVGLDAMPTRPGNGKLDYKRLPPPPTPSVTGDGGSLGTTKRSGDSPVEGLEAIILRTWATALSAPNLGLDDNFFDVGGHSLIAANVTGVLSGSFGLVGLTVIDLFSNPTVRLLGAHLRRQGHGEVGGSGSKQKGGRRAAAHAELPDPTRVIQLFSGNKTAGGGGATSQRGAAIAVIGMAGVFPGAANIGEFWQNLRGGIDWLRRFSNAELASKGVPAEVYTHPNWVGAAQLLDNPDHFDAFFWGISATEARLMDPQQRMFLQTAWHAVESAGYAPRSGTPTRTGVFAACGIDGYLIHHLEGGGLHDPLDPGRWFLTETGNEKDYIATRVSYQLDLGGPSFTVNSACSSGLVALASAAASLRAGQCDMAIAGASSLTFPGSGYLYADGLVASVDGHVRPFDAAASGTLFGDSVGAVVLKRLDEAQRDGDEVLAVISGFDVTNDGRQKAGYAAPNASAQRNSILRAQYMAGVTADEVSYVECHATATKVGDAIEMRGLVDAFAANRAVKGTDVGAQDAHACALGSVKGNIGHANCAAGITGFIKTVLCLQHETLVPTAHFKSLNPKFDSIFAQTEGGGGDAPRRTDFAVNTELQAWTLPSSVARRVAGVSSFGVGGTNCHIVLEEAPQLKAAAAATTAETSARWPITPFSAKTHESLERLVSSSVGFFSAAALVSEMNAAHVVTPHNAAFTLQTGRESFDYRAVMSVDAGASLGELSSALEAALSGEGGLRGGESKVRSTSASGGVAFVFPGQGSQYLGMGRGLYETEPVYRATIDECATVLSTLGAGFDLKATLYADPSDAAARAEFARPSRLQPAMFATELAMAKTLVAFGIEPIAIAGHSIGEYVAACFSGAIGLEDAVKLIARRGQLTEDESPVGAMLSVGMESEPLQLFLDQFNAETSAEMGNLTLAADNAPALKVVSGSEKAVASAEATLKARGVRVVILHVNRAFHSPLMSASAAQLVEAAQSIELKTPALPMASNVTGEWITEDDLTPEYFGRHMSGAVRWTDDAACLLRWKPFAILEVGPGGTLCKLTAKCVDPDSADAAPLLLQTMRHPRAVDDTDAQTLANFVGRLWQSGFDLDWAAYHNAGADAVRPVKCGAPTYTFQPTSFWDNPDASMYVDEEEEEEDEEEEEEEEDYAEEERGEAEVVAVVVKPKTCLVRFKQCAAPRVVVYCLPYAGGSSRVFQAWSLRAPSWLDIVAIELRGRGARMDAPLCAADADDAAEADFIASCVALDLAQRGSGVSTVALCGMSMGANMAVELAHNLRRDPSLVDVKVERIAIIGRAPPAPRVVGKTSFEDDVASYALASAEVQESSAWTEYFLPMLLSDLDTDARTSSRVAGLDGGETNTPLLECSLSVFAGLSDPAFDWTAATAWSRISALSQRSSAKDAFSLHFYPGEHSFMNEHADDIFSTIEASLRPVGIALQSSLSSTAASSARTAEEEGDEAGEEESAILKDALHCVRYVGIASGDVPSGAADTSSDIPFWSISGSYEHDASSKQFHGLDVTGIRAQKQLIVDLHSDRQASVVFGESAVAAEKRQCWHLTQLIQELLRLEIAADVVVIAPASARCALAVGVTKSVSFEFPELRFRRVMVKTTSGSAYGSDDATTSHYYSRVHCIACAGNAAKENDLMLELNHSNQRFNLSALRLAPPPTMPMAGSSIASHLTSLVSGSSGGVFLLTGATGGIGNELLKWLVQTQRVPPSALVVLSRRSRDAMASDALLCSAPFDSIRVITVDCANAAKLEACEELTQLERVRGVFHLAGMLDDGA